MSLHIAHTHPVDQVVRKELFLAEHPDVVIHSPLALGGNEWRAMWEETTNDSTTSRTVTRHELSSILDILEDHFGVPGGE